jgi:hypothetical protein
MQINEKGADDLMHMISLKAMEALNASGLHDPEHPHGYEAVREHEQEHEHEHGDGDEREVLAVLTAKTVTMVTLCLVSVFMGLIPMQIAKCFKIISSEKIVNPRYVVSLPHCLTHCCARGPVLSSLIPSEWPFHCSNGTGNLRRDSLLARCRAYI